MKNVKLKNNFRMKIAIIYASKHGTTEKVAGLIVEKLKDNEISLFNVTKTKFIDIENFDYLILGTSIYAANPIGVMKNFCAKNLALLKEKPHSLFVCGMEPDAEKQQMELDNAFPLELQQNAVNKCFAGGEFMFEKMNFFEKFIIKRIAKTDKNVSAIKCDNIEVFLSEINLFIKEEQK